MARHFGVSYVGGVVGYLQSGSMSDPESASNVQATGLDAGGIAGYNAGAIYGAGAYAGPIGQTVFGNISGAANVGGAVGFNAASGLVDYAKAYGGVTGTGSNIGGMVGVDAGGRVTNSTANGAVGGVSDVGGLVGWASAGSILSGDNASGPVTATGNDIGGLVGYDLGSISNSGATGTVSGAYVVGGLVGYAAAGSVLTSDTASGAATGTYDFVGGLVGDNFSTLSASSATARCPAATTSAGWRVQ